MFVCVPLVQVQKKQRLRFIDAVTSLCCYLCASRLIRLDAHRLLETVTKLPIKEYSLASAKQEAAF